MRYLVVIWSVICVCVGIYAFVFSLNNSIDTHFYAILCCLYVIGLLMLFGATKAIQHSSKIPQIPRNDIVPIDKRDVIFLCMVATLCVAIGVFTFWLGFPGFINVSDIHHAILLDKGGFHPVITPYFLEFLYTIFGKHTYYLFILNLATFYTGIYFLIAGFYIRFRSFWAILLLFLTFIGNIYLGNFVSMSYVGLYNLLFCAFSMILFLLLVPYCRYKKIMIYIIGILLFFAILWRHNAVFSVFPISFLFIYLLLKNKTLDSPIRYYIAGIGLCAVVCLFVVIFIPKALVRGEMQPANHILLHQIAGACVPADDRSCFKDSWYLGYDSEWEQIKSVYNENPIFADFFNGLLIVDDGLFTHWLKAIIKYPYNYLIYQSRFFYGFWFGNPKDDFVDDIKNISRSVIKSPHNLQLKFYYNDSELVEFPQNEHKVTLTPIRLQIYTFIYDNAIIFNHFIGVAIGFVILVSCGVLLLFYRNALLVFSFSVSFASIGSAIFITAFNPVVYSRYFAPILPLSIIALVGFIAFMLDRVKSR